jgi:hypothetical protein
VRGRPVVPLRCGTANVVEGVLTSCVQSFGTPQRPNLQAYDLTFTATVTTIVSLSNGS